MRSAVTDRVAWSVGRSATLLSRTKTAEPIEMPFWFKTRVGPENHVLDGVQMLPWDVAVLRGKGCKV